jgi:hypothetical protein
MRTGPEERETTVTTVTTITEPTAMSSKAAPRTLFADDVTISTVAVTLKAITINKRQMTQSIFKQLEPLPGFIDYERCAIAAGVAWGYVNFLAGPTTRQFLVQSGDRLYRNPVEVYPSSWLRVYAKNSYSPAFVPPIFRRALERYQGLAGRCAEAHALLDALEGKDTERGCCYFGKTSHEIDDGFGSIYRHVEFQCKRDGVKMVVVPEDVQARLAKEFGHVPTRTEVDGWRRESLAGLRDYVDRWDRLMAELGEVEQLFIAG